MGSQFKNSVKLNNGNVMPLVGLGTFQGNYNYTSAHDAVVSAVKSAVDVGYRHFDSAFIYDTERGLGEGLRAKIQEGVVTREDLFVTTKLWSTSHRRELVVPALQRELGIMGLDYVDMYLIHWPVALAPSEEIWPVDSGGSLLFEDDRTTNMECWQGMEECVRLGLARSIGLSNFNRRQTQQILDNCTIRPTNNQIEVNPFFQNNEIVQCCEKNGIVVSCASPLGKPNRHWAKEGDPFIFSDPTILELAKKYNKTVAQITLRHQVQQGHAVVPKSNSPERQAENLNIFDFKLSDEDMKAMAATNRDFRALWLEKLIPSKEYPHPNPPMPK